MEDKDLDRHHFTREYLEDLCGHIVQRSTAPVVDALRMAELSPVSRRVINVVSLPFVYLLTLYFSISSLARFISAILA